MDDSEPPCLVSTDLRGRPTGRRPSDLTVGDEAVVVRDARVMDATRDLPVRPLGRLVAADEAEDDFLVDAPAAARATVFGAAPRAVRATPAVALRVAADRLEAGTRAAFEDVPVLRTDLSRVARDDALPVEERRVDEETEAGAALVRDPAADWPDFARDAFATETRAGRAGADARVDLMTAGTLADLGALEVREVFEETDERVVLAIVVGRDGLETAVGRNAFAVPVDRDDLGAVDRDAFVTGADRGVFDAVVGRSALTAAAARDDLAEVVDLVALAARFALGAADFARTGAFTRAAVALPRPAVLPGLVPGLAERPA